MEHLFEPQLQHLRALPFVRKLAPVPLTPSSDADLGLKLKAPGKTYRLNVLLVRTHLTEAIVDRAASKLNPPDSWILFAPHVGAPMAAYLASRQLNYVDAAGNCRLGLGTEHIAVIEGRRQTRTNGHGPGIRAPGYRVLFAVLARPGLLNATVRDLAAEAGVGKSAAAELLRRLDEDGAIGGPSGARRLLSFEELLTRWLAGYGDVVRPGLSFGRWRTPDRDPMSLMTRIEPVLGLAGTWAWGGGAAAFRLTGHYRGEETVVHLDRLPPGLPRQLQAVRDPNGPLHLLGVPGPVALEGAAPGTAHPLLVYTELLISRSERAREAAAEVAQRYLGGLAS